MSFDLKILGKEVHLLDAQLKLLKSILCQRLEKILVSNF